jgi:pimeloyl-ACP methyl ester carboxylesterase
VSDAAREKFIAAYERAFALWPQPWEEFDLETATATTRVHAYRPHPGGEPVVLLTGAGGNAAAWFPHVAALAEDGPVYAIDMPGDANPSIPRAPMTPPAACASWLDELLGKLSDRQAPLVGFYRWLTISGLASLTPMPIRRRLARWLDSPAMLEPELLTLMWAGIRGYRMEPKFPAVLTDDELRAITVPVLLITGARSAMLTPAEARARGSLMPHAQVAVVPGSHGGFNRISELNQQIAAFIKAQATSKPTDQPARPAGT